MHAGLKTAENVTVTKHVNVIACSEDHVTVLGVTLLFFSIRLGK
jgi:hypothetical protein